MRREHTTGSEGPGARSRPVALLADDLTGVCDAAIAFAREGDPVHISFTGVEDARGEVWATSLDTRDRPLFEVELRLAQAAARLDGHFEIFKKIDSAVRGNSFDEIALTARLFAADVIIVAPAYPALGRRSVHGMLYIETATERRAVDVEAALRDRGCGVEMISASRDPEELTERFGRGLAAGVRMMLCDAQEQAHLMAMVEAADQMGLRTLWVGSGGLAHALAAARRPRPRAVPAFRRRGDTLFFIGSNHASTCAQVSKLQEESGLWVSACRDANLTAHGSALLSVSRDRTTAAHIYETVAACDPARIACLFMTGGDTAQLVCRALEIRSLRLLHEFEPGVPLGIAEGGRFNGAAVVLKSGGFGESDLLCRILKAFGSDETDRKDFSGNA